MQPDCSFRECFSSRLLRRILQRASRRIGEDVRRTQGSGVTTNGGAVREGTFGSCRSDRLAAPSSTSSD
ncbi:hypothetical protein OJAV_G00085130 [Oryzias javanicus]|uniref:Uncharacterized protein n=1 Tax=Oryzias javanicus TaxID=123683 RepID=A0A437CYW8_ORYJA|nr:hypothetical protein OJAV_G00085130 [Oryzias javanicus]